MARIDAIGEECSLFQDNSRFSHAIEVSRKMKEIRSALTPEVLADVSELQNSPMGFLTDRPAGGYDADTIREVLIWAVPQGLPVLNNCFNIIAGRGYVTKNGMKWKLSHVPGLSFGVTPGIPRSAGESGAVIEMTIRWNYNGKNGEQKLIVPVRVNKGMGADAIIGKATRKSYAWLYEQITGNMVSEGEVGDNEPITVPVQKVSPIEEPTGKPHRISEPLPFDGQ